MGHSYAKLAQPGSFAHFPPLYYSMPVWKPPLQSYDSVLGSLNSALLPSVGFHFLLETPVYLAKYYPE